MTNTVRAARSARTPDVRGGRPGAAAQAMVRLPAVGVIFWATKIVSTTLGESISNYVAIEPMNLGYAAASLIFLVVLAFTLYLQIRTDRYRPMVFWSVILVTSIVGTAMSDLVNRGLGLGYAGGALALTTLLVVVLAVWWRSGLTMDVERIDTPRAEAFYWGATLVSNTLGTSSGDYLADGLGFGFRESTLIIGTTLVLILCAHYWTSLPGTALFWAAYVLTRPLGAVAENAVEKPVARGGLGVGTTITSAVLLTALFFLLRYQTRSTSTSAHPQGPARRRPQGARKGMAGAVSKLPAITATFWIMKIIATTLGETAGDLLAQTLRLGYAVATLVLIGVFVASLVAQLRSQEYQPYLYWSVILSTSMAGTTISDFMNRDVGYLAPGEQALGWGPQGFGLGYPAGAAILISILGVIFAVWRRTGLPMSLARIVTPKGETLFWSAILVSNTLGTSLGDFLADSSGLGYLGGALLISTLLVILAYLVDRPGVSHTAVFWAAFVLTRPLGATLGDLLTKSPEKHGLGLGTLGSSAVLAVALVWLVNRSSAGSTSSTSRARRAGRRLGA